MIDDFLTFFYYFCLQNSYAMKKLCPLALLLVLAPLLTCHASSFYFHTVNVKDGLADNFVRDIIRDSQGYMWLSTINGLSRYDGYRFKNYTPSLSGHANDIHLVRETADHTLWMICEHELLTYDRASDSWKADGVARMGKLGLPGSWDLFYVDDKHDLWVATDNGLFHYDYSKREVQQFPNYSKSTFAHIVSKDGNTVVVTNDYKIYMVAMREKRLIPVGQAEGVAFDRDNRVYLDNHLNLWIYNSHSLAGTQWLFSIKTRQLRQMVDLRQVGNVVVNTIAEDNEGNLWVGTLNDGIHVFSYKEQGLGAKVMDVNPFLHRSSHFSCFYLDDNNTMWVGSAKHGVAFTDLNQPSFNLVSTGELEEVSSMMEDAKGNLWIGFDGGGVMVKYAAGGETHFSALKQQLPSNIVTSLVTLPDGTVLAGTYGNGIARFDGSKFVPLYPDVPLLQYVKALATDTRGNLWVATVDKGVVKIDLGGKMENYTSRNSSLQSNGVLCLAYDSSRNIMYVGTSTGVSAYDCAKGQFITIKPLERLKGSYVSSLMVGNDDILFAGTRNGLWFYRPKDGSVGHVTTEQGMSHNVVRALAKSGNQVWVSTDNGLTSVTMQEDGDGKLACKCHPFFDNDGLHGVVFSDDAALTTSDGTALMGSFTGYVRILPENICAPGQKLQVRFTDFRINGKSEQKSLDNLTIHYHDNLGIAVSAMVPTHGKIVRYYYRFKGEDEWMKAPENVLYFATLGSGSHVLQVKAVMPGMGESQVAELPIYVTPPFWLTKTAFLLYFLAIACILYLNHRAARRRQKRELAIKQMEVNLKKYEMEEEKIMFYTNISHDLKTPLTLVVAPLEKIRQTNLPAPIKTEVEVAWRNARQLYDLVLQLLDFRRLDVGAEKLNLKHGDIVGFIRQTVQEFSYYATRKNILLDTRLPLSAVEINFDEQKIRRIITNLLSNAFKYNVDNGSVVVALDIQGEESQRKMVISVADSGIGIKDKWHVFERFTQETHGQEQEGSGLGLHIVKHYVEMMEGSITVTDNNPQGTVFTVTLPVNDVRDASIEELPAADGFMEENETGPNDALQEKPVILVVDDNMDARLFLQRSLDDEYDVLVAANGKEALAILEENDKVGIVVSDVMMPVMDGITLFRHIKSNIKFSHIPVILLTAKSGEENIVEGLKEGAADYITKPFSLAVLKLRIQKVLEWTQNAHHKVANGIEIKPSDITVSSLDEEFISNVIANVEANIQDMDYSVVQLSSAVGLTRGHLYKKLMAITGKPPLEFIRIIKLKRGKSLLDQGKTNISEVADMVGFSPKQFAHYFKLMYHETPSEYLKKRRK